MSPALRDADTPSVDSYTLERAIQESRVYIVDGTPAERAFLPEHFPPSRPPSRCNCRSSITVQKDSYLAPFKPPTCSWTQRPIRHVPLVSSYGGIPLEYLDFDDATEEDHALDTGKENDEDRLPYKVRAPTVIKFALVLVCLWVLRSIHSWWVAKQSQVRFERLLASASFGNLSEPKKSSLNRGRSKTPKREVVSTPTPPIPTPPPRQPLIPRIRHDAARVNQILMRRFLILHHKLQTMIGQAFNEVETFRKHTCCFISRTVLTCPRREVQSAHSPFLADHFTDHPPTTKESVKFHDQASGPGAQFSKPSEKSRIAALGTPPGSHKEVHPVVASGVLSTPSLLLSQSQLKQMQSASSTASGFSVAESKEGYPSQSTEEKYVLTSLSTELEVTLVRGDSQTEPTTRTQSWALNRRDSRLCRLQATALSIEPTEVESKSKSTQTDIVDQVEVGVGPPETVMRCASVQVTPPAPPQKPPSHFRVQQTTIIVEESTPQAWTRMRIGRPTWKQKRNSIKRRLQTYRMHQQRHQEQQPPPVLPPVAIPPVLPPVAIPPVLPPVAIPPVLPPVLPQQETQHQNRPLTDLLHQVWDIPLAYERPPLYVESTANKFSITEAIFPSPESLTTCITTPGLQWASQKQTDDMDTSKNSLEPPPGFERVLAKSSGTPQSPTDQFPPCFSDKSFLSPSPVTQGTSGFIPRGLASSDLFGRGGMPPAMSYISPVGGPLAPETSCGTVHRTDAAKARTADNPLQVGKPNR